MQSPSSGYLSFSLLIIILQFLVSPVLLMAQVDAEFEAYLNLRMAQEKIPGLSIALITPGENVAYHHFGYADPEQTRPVDEHTLFEIGSITKTFTGNLFLMLMDEFDFTGSTPVRELLWNDETMPSYEGEEITFDHLLTHHSGLPRLPGNLVGVDDRDPYKEYTIGQLLDFLESHTLRRAPGESYEYSNLGYMVLGYLAESFAKASYDDLIELYITGPLDMPSTSRILADSSRFATPTAFGERVHEWNFDHIRGPGELRSSTRDMANYLKAHLKKLPETPLANAMKKSRQPIVSLNENTAFGTSWMISTREMGPSHPAADRDTLVHHGGGTGGFRAFAGFSPVTGRGVVVLSNSVADIEDIGLHLLNPMAFALKELIEETDISSELLDRMAGLYISSLLPPFTVTHDGSTLFAQLEGQPALPYAAISDTVFTNRIVGAELHFELEDHEDAATALTLHQAGQQISFERSDEKPEAPEEIELPIDQLREYTGQFRSDSTGLVYTFTLQDDQLIAQLTGQPGVPVYPEAKDRFFYKAVVAQLHFERDETNEVHAVVLHQEGQEIRFIREE